VLVQNIKRLNHDLCILMNNFILVLNVDFSSSVCPLSYTECSLSPNEYTFSSNECTLKSNEYTFSSNQ